MRRPVDFATNVNVGKSLAEALMRLQDAEQSASCITPADEAEALLNIVATVQAYILFLQGDLATSVALAGQALKRLTETQGQEREVANLIAAHRRPYRCSAFSTSALRARSSRLNAF